MRCLPLFPVALAAAALTAPSPARADEESEQAGSASDEVGLPLRAGFLVGLNLSSFNGADVDESPTETHTARVAPAAGAFLRYDVTERFGVQAEVFLSSKGATFSDDFSEGTASLHYLEFPLLGKVFFPLEGPISLHAYGGFSVNYLLSGEVRESDTGTMDLKEVTKNVDAGFIIAVGGSLPAGDESILLDLRYELGLRNFDDDADGDGIDREAHHSVFTFLAGYEF